MIIAIILTLCIFATWLFIPHKLTRYILGALSIMALLLFIVGITANMKSHWGMEKKVVTSKEQEIFSAGSKNSPTNMLIANEIGENTNNYVMVFKKHQNDEEAKTHFKPNMKQDNISESVKQQAKYEVKDTDRATMQTKKEIWVWKSDFYKSLFNFGEDKQELIKSTTTVTVPKDTWVVLNANQAKKLQKSQKGTRNKATQQQEKMMQQLTMKYKKDHPNATQQEINDYLLHEQQVQATMQINKELNK